MRFIKRTSLIAFIALGAVAYGYAPEPEPSYAPMITYVPIPTAVTDYPSYTAPSVPDTDYPTFTAVPIPTPAEPTVEPSEEPTESPEPTDPSPIPPTPAITVSPAPTYTNPGCGHGCVPPSPHPVPSKDVCFEKKQTCCYKHFVCDTKTKEVKYCKAVKSQKCEKKCEEKKCIMVPKTTMKKKCKKETVYEERKDCITKWFGMCKPVAVEKEVCCDHAVTMYEKVCKDICNRFCKPVTVYQIIIKKYKYETFCARLSCGNIKIVGKAVKPPSYKSKTLVHKTDGNVVNYKPAGIVQLN